MTAPDTASPSAPDTASPSAPDTASPAAPRDTAPEVLVIGGGAGGLAAALTLARARRRVLVVDAGEPRNAPAAGVHNYLGREGTPPRELTALGRAEVEAYGGEIVVGAVEGLSTGSEADPEAGFAWTLADGTRGTAAAVVLATGAEDVLPDIPGLAERWGRTVIHCPYCHGWEVRDRALGVIGVHPMSSHQAMLAQQWSRDVVFFAQPGLLPDAEQRARMDALGIRVVEGAVAEVEGQGDAVTGVRLEDGRAFARDALFVASEPRPRDGLALALGAETASHPAGGEVLTVDLTGQTTVPRLWAVGNAVDPMAQVIVSAAAGMRVGAAINGTLVDLQVARALRG